MILKIFLKKTTGGESGDPSFTHDISYYDADALCRQPHDDKEAFTFEVTKGDRAQRIYVLTKTHGYEILDKGVTIERYVTALPETRPARKTD